MGMENLSMDFLDVKHFIFSRFVEFAAGFSPSQREYYEVVKGRPGINGELTLTIREVTILIVMFITILIVV